MDRRSFLGALPLSAATLNLASAAPGFQPASAAGEAANFPLPPGADYFTLDRLRSLVDISVSLSGIPFQAVVFNFPSYHPSPAMEKHFGKGWTEFETVRHAKPQFEGHIQPKRPLWGYFNEADPVWAEREIETASSAGIHAFMVDWYWHLGTMFYHEQLEQGFLRAANRQKLRFAIMWANHDWENVYPAPEFGQNAVIYPQTYSEADMDRIADYAIEHYFREPNYWQIDGQPVFAIFAVNHILKFFGVEKLRASLDRMRNRAARAGLKGLHVQGCFDYVPGETPLRNAGFDSVTNYHPFAGGPGGKTSEYATGIEKSIQVWKSAAPKLDIPYFPDCPVGWDNSPRFGRRAHVFIHRTPDQYELFLLAAKYFEAGQRTRPPVIFLSAWNEWTEDHYLLPDEVYGYSYLEAVRRQFLP